MNNFTAVGPLTLVLLLFSSSVFHTVSCHKSCLRNFNVFGVPKDYSTCQRLESQGAALAWTFYKANNRLETVFSGTAASINGWVGWGVNPTDRGMVGASVLVAFQAFNGSNVLPYKLTAAAAGGERLLCSAVDLHILDKAVQISGTQMKIITTLQLKPGQTTLNLVWNRGSNVVDFSPEPHSLLPQDLRAFATIDLLKGSV